MALPEHITLRQGPVAFHTTHWSVVLGAGNGDSPEAAQALERLCASYWYPIYGYIRRAGHSPEDAQDLTQDFFVRLIERGYLRLADASRGKFRTFLLTSIKHFLVNEWEKSHTAKRGGNHEFVSWDLREAEGRYNSEPTDGIASDSLFEQRWAVSLLERVLAEVRKEFQDEGRGQLFEALRNFLWGSTETQSYERLSAQHCMTEGALRAAVYRLRKRFRQILREEVAHTVSTAAEVDEELRHLMEVVRR